MSERGWWGRTSARIKRSDELRWVILFVTSRCNSRCSTCFYWSRLDDGADLGLDQIERIARGMPPFRTLLLSGGEPFLRDDLAEVCRLFRRHNRVSHLSIPTNGLATTRILAATERILRDNPGLRVSVNVSLDGMAATHDAIRGVPGGFDRGRETLRSLVALQGRLSGLSVVVNTVICPANLSEIDQVANLVKSLRVDGHYFEVIRGDPRAMKREGMDAGALAEAYRTAANVAWFYAKRRARAGFPWSPAAELLGAAGTLYQYRLQYENYVSGAPWPMECLAGRTIAVVEHDGSLKACELRPAVRVWDEWRGDLAKVWRSESLERERGAIARDRCFCTHGCFIVTSANHSPMSRFGRASWQLLKHAVSGAGFRPGRSGPEPARGEENTGRGSGE